MRLSLFAVLFLLCLTTYAQVPPNDDIGNAIPLTNITGYCSQDKEYANINATTSPNTKAIFWSSTGKDIWYKITVVKTDISITVTGKSDVNSPNTLISPLVALYTYVFTADGWKLSESNGSMTTSNNITTAYKGGLITGTEYYIRISAENDNTGTFKLCINNFNPPNRPGQDCSTASLLCSKESFTETSLSGSGTNNHEAAGTCLLTESNTGWYKWVASSSGTLTFNIIPTSKTDDIDWVLFDLGTTGNCSEVNPANAIRCAAGNGITCTPSYYITGTNLSSTDLSEQPNCPTGQDGFVKYVDMIAGHTYALMIDNSTNGTSDNNGFTLEFGGSADFVGPATEITITKDQLCTPNQDFTFSAVPETGVSLLWNFGEGASLASSTSNGPPQITYSSYGPKSISLEATSPQGCKVTTYYNLYVSLQPDKPEITINNTLLCPGNILKFNTPYVVDAKYIWTGPAGFNSELQNPTMLITGNLNAGTYHLTVKVGDCLSETGTYDIPSIFPNPSANFSTAPLFNEKYAVPATFNFSNLSINATSYLWDFGDGNTSEEENPSHTYTTAGNYEISLKALNQNSCFNSISKGELILVKDGSTFIPGTFTPNGDGINDKFEVRMINIKSYNLIIFNRYGTKLFESKDILNSWTGKYQSEDLPTGVYYYLITGLSKTGQIFRHSGSVMLMR